MSGDTSRGRGLHRGTGRGLTSESGSPGGGILPPPSRSPTKQTPPSRPVSSLRLDTTNLPNVPSPSGFTPNVLDSGRSPSRSPTRPELPTGWTVEHAQWLSIANPDTLSAEIRVILHNLGVLATKVDQLTHAVVAALGGGSAGAKPKVMADENEEDALRRIAELPDGTVDNTLKEFRQSKKGDSPLKSQRGNPSKKEAAEFRDFVGERSAAEAEQLDAMDLDEHPLAAEGREKPMADFHGALMQLTDDVLGEEYVRMVKQSGLGAPLGGGSRKKPQPKAAAETTAEQASEAGPRKSGRKRKPTVRDGDDDEQDEQMDSGAEDDGPSRSKSPKKTHGSRAARD